MRTALSARYRQWIEAADRSAFDDLIARGASHWLDLARRLVALHAQQGEGSAEPIAREIEGAVL